MTRIDSSERYIVVRNMEPFRMIGTVVAINESIVLSTNAVVSRWFRYSINGADYSHWIELDLTNLNEVITDYGDLINDLWIDFKIELESGDYFNFNSLTIDVETKERTAFSIPFAIYNKLEETSRYHPNEPYTSNFHIYAQDKTLDLHKRLSYLMNEIFGFNCLYFKGDPEFESRDALNLEYGLLSYRDPVDMNIIVPDNEFPSNDLSFSPIEGISFEQPFEIHVDKRYFEQVFGVNQKPQKDDAILFDITDRFYQVLDSEIVRSFMNQPVYYKVSLVKFEKKSYIGTNENVDQIFDDNMNNVMEVLGHEILEQELDVTNQKQFSIKQDRWDYVRLYHSDFFRTSIESYDLINYDITVSHYIYNIWNTYKHDGITPFIIYKFNDIFREGQTRTLTHWINLKEDSSKTKTVKSVEHTGTDPLEYTIRFSTTPPVVKRGEFLKIFNIDYNLDVRAIVLETKNEETGRWIKVVFESQDVLDDLNDTIPTWSSITGTQARKLEKHFLFGNMIDGAGFMLNLYDRQIIELNINGTITNYTLDYQLPYNRWMANIYTLSDEFKSFIFYNYEIKDGTNNLDLINYLREDLEIPNLPVTGWDHMYVQSSPMQMTNLRWLNTTIPEEKHKIFLNQILVSDSSKCMIIDNADPENIMPYIGVAK